MTSKLFVQNLVQIRILDVVLRIETFACFFAGDPGAQGLCDGGDERWRCDGGGIQKGGRRREAQKGVSRPPPHRASHGRTLHGGGHHRGGQHIHVRRE